MADLTSAELRKRISKILKDADLTTLSSKKVRKQLEEEFDIDLTERKQEVDSIVMEIITENDKENNSTDGEEEENHISEDAENDNSEEENHNSDSVKGKSSESEEEYSPPQKKKALTTNKKKTPSTSNKKKVAQKKKPVAKSKHCSGSEDSDEDSFQSKKKKKKTNSTKKCNDSEDSDNFSKDEIKVEDAAGDHSASANSDIEDDEALARKLQEEERRGRSRAVKKTVTNRRVAKKKDANSDGTKVKKKGGTYSRKCILSPELASLVGADEMARSEVVKTIWDIVKSKNLFDPSNKQFALCDDELRKVFGVKRVRMFSMMKRLKPHIKDPE